VTSSPELDRDERPDAGRSRRNRRACRRGAGSCSPPRGRSVDGAIARAAGVGSPRCNGTGELVSSSVGDLPRRSCRSIRDFAERHHSQQEPWEALARWLRGTTESRCRPRAHARRAWAPRSMAGPSCSRLRRGARSAAIVLDPGGEGCGAGRPDQPGGGPISCNLVRGWCCRGDLRTVSCKPLGHRAARHPHGLTSTSSAPSGRCGRYRVVCRYSRLAAPSDRGRRVGVRRIEYGEIPR